MVLESRILVLVLHFLCAASALGPSETVLFVAPSYPHIPPHLIRGAWANELTPRRCGEKIDQCQTPLIDALERASSTVRVPFFFPGHRMGTGAGSEMLRRVLPRNALALDLPEDIGGLDCLSDPCGPIG